MSILAFRGEEKIEEPDLRAHLATVLRLEHIGVLLGAGASVGAGGKTVKNIWTDFIASKKQHADVLVEEGFLKIEDINAGSFDGGSPRPLPNIEDLLDNIEIALIDWNRRKPASRNRKKLQASNDALLSTIVDATILSEGWWKDPRSDKSKLSDHKRLLQRIVGARQPGQTSPWIFTTNYDLAIEWSAEDVGLHVHTGFVGIHNRTFSPQSYDLGLRNIHARGEARFGCGDIYLAKLHGSLSWMKHGLSDFRELSANEMWPIINDLRRDGGEGMASVMVFPRAAKYLQTVGFLSGELFRRFSDFLGSPQSVLLVSGYSFGDEHINRLLYSAILNPTLQIVIFLPEFSGIEPQQVEAQKDSVKRILSLKSPRITMVGGVPSAYFSAFTSYLPDPMLYDLAEKEMKERLEEGGNDK